MVEADIRYSDQIEEFRREIFEHAPGDGNRFAGCMLLDEADSTENWIKNESAQKR